MSDWQPIETAPKDGRPLLLARGTLVWLAPNSRRSIAQHERHGSGPTHWMPVPNPPALLTISEQGKKEQKDDVET